MATDINETPLIVITGPTASGKTGVALELAKKYNGEIVCADSRTVYKGLDIGTAKPTSEEQALIPHHILDVVAPDEQYNLARFQHDAKAAIAAIRQRKKVPILVGGSGLYIDSIALEYQLGSDPDLEQRAELEVMSIEELFEYSNNNNINLPNNLYNKRYVIRAIEQNGVNTRRLDKPSKSTIVVGIKTDSEVLKARILQRSEAMFNRGIQAEALAAAMQYGWNIPPLQSPEYKVCNQLLKDEITQQEAIAVVARGDWQLARKQMTWMRRNQWITWRQLDEVVPFFETALSGRGTTPSD